MTPPPVSPRTPLSSSPLPPPATRRDVDAAKRRVKAEAAAERIRIAPDRGIGGPFNVGERVARAAEPVRVQPLPGIDDLPVASVPGRGVWTWGLVNFLAAVFLGLGGAALLAFQAPWGAGLLLAAAVYAAIMAVAAWTFIGLALLQRA